MLLSFTYIVDFYPKANGCDRKGEYNGGGIFCRLMLASKVTRPVDDRVDNLTERHHLLCETHVRLDGILFWSRLRGIGLSGYG
jgi:hypothetical protein